MTGAIGRSTPTPTASAPQPTMMDRLRGAGSSVMDTLREAGARRLESQAQPGSLGPQLRVSRGTLPNPFSGAPVPKLLSGDPEGAAQSLPGALIGLATHGEPAKPLIGAMDDNAIRHLAETLKKTTPYGYIDYGSLKGNIQGLINPKVQFPGNKQMATFGEMYRGVMKFMRMDPEDVPNPDFIKALAKAFNEIVNGEHKLPPGSQPKMK